MLTCHSITIFMIFPWKLIVFTRFECDGFIPILLSVRYVMTGVLTWAITSINTWTMQVVVRFANVDIGGFNYHHCLIFLFMIYNISQVSWNIKFMCTRLKNWIKARFIEPFPSLVQNTHKLYILRNCINIVFNLQKNHINPLPFIF